MVYASTSFLYIDPNHANVCIYREQFFFGFSRQGFSVALEPLLELALVDQAGLELTEVHLPLSSEYWD